MIDYAELRDPDSLEPAPPRITGPTLLALAVWLRPAEGSAGPAVRLIDNRVLHPLHDPIVDEANRIRA